MATSPLSQKHKLIIGPGVIIVLVVIVVGLLIGPPFLAPFWDSQFVPYLTVIAILMTWFIVSIAGWYTFLILQNDGIILVGFPFLTKIKRDEIKYIFRYIPRIKNAVGGNIFFIPQKPYKKYQKLGIVNTRAKHFNLDIEKIYAEGDIKECGELPSKLNSSTFYMIGIIDPRYMKSSNIHIPVDLVFEALKPVEQNVRETEGRV